MKKLLTVLLLAATALAGHAQEWIDLTDSYIVNPRFDNNDRSTGWSGTGLSAYNPKENAEHYEKNYDTWQDIYGLTPGNYRLSLNAFYRMGDADNDYRLYKSGDYASSQHAKLYATSSSNDYETSIMPASAAALENSLGGNVKWVEGSLWWGGKCIPDNMEAANYWFEAGHYQNSVECTVDNDGYLRIGIRKFTLIGGDWTCIDNWKLEYWGTVTQVTSITLSQSSMGLVPGEIGYLTTDVQPSDATYRNVNWSSSNEDVATVDSKGQVTAIGKGSCYITATAKDSSGKSARCHVTVSINTPSASNIIINEIMAANVDVYLDPSQNYGSWVELYNPTNKGVTLGGLYVTDDPKNLKKHRLIDSYGALSANGYALLNFDHFEVWTPNSYRQIDDELDCEGGTIIISDGTTIIAQQDYDEAISRTSYARTTDGGETWGITGNPTPGSSNQLGGGFATTQLPAPVVDQDGQIFEGTLRVCVNIPNGTTLRYTTDGTTPTMTNGETSGTGLFSVNETTCYRFRLFQDGYLPSRVVTRTYIYNNDNEPFPIISIVTDPDNIYDTDRGAFGEGQYGRPGNGQSGKCNWNMSWDRPVSFEYIDENGECLVSQECNFSMCGGWSRAYTPHAFKLKAKKYYDFENTFQAQFFEAKPYLKHKTLQIRNGGNDTGCRIKDGAIQQIVARSGLDVDYQEWKPVHVYINGQSYAVLNMREPNNKHYAYANYGIDTDEMDQFEMSPDSGYVQMTGTKESFDLLLELSQNAANADTYEEIGKLLDIDEYINYMAVELFIGNWDWPQNNVKGFRDVNDGKFRFVLFDLDGALSTQSPFQTFFDKENYTFDRLYGYDYSRNESIDGNRNWRQIEFVTLFKNMLQNDQFRKQFIDTYCIVGGSVFQSDKVSAIVDDMRNHLNQGGYVNSSSTANTIINTFNDGYNSNLVYSLKNWSDMKLGSITRQIVNLSANTEGAKILVNNIEVPYSKFDGYLFAPITLKAEAPAGYRFMGWASKVTSSAQKIFDKGSDWLYYDQGSLDGKSWKSITYGTSSWKNGTAIIGYDYNNMHPDIVTETQGNKPTYYFRKSFNLAATPTDNDEFTLDFTIDDGLVVYVNGTEAGRYNMPDGNVTYSTLATSYAPNNPDTGTLTLKGSLFRQGTNVIAVEVHNNNETSTDIMWDASLTAELQDNSQNDYASTDEEYTLPSSGKQVVTAIFENISDADMLAQGITPVRVNEVSAANSMYVNDYFKKNDWIELYNTTAADINLAGMYISDNAEKPQKYHVPSDNVLLNTIIPAHGYKVIWCDKLANIGADIHTSFKLAAEGGDVLITTSTYSDTLHYDTHDGTQSFGRYPDGGNNTYVMNLPTIAKANKLTSIDTLYYSHVEPTPDAIRSYTKEGGLTIAFVNGVVNVKSEDAPIASVSIHTSSGIKMATPPVMRSNEHFATINVASLPKGIYVASATTSTGDNCHIKFTVR